MVEVLGFIPPLSQGVADLVVGIQQGEFGVDITFADQPDLKDIPGYYLNGTGNFWVAVENGQVVGTIALKDIGNKAAALRKMFVAKSHRGADQGVAKELLTTLLGHARMGGLRDIYLGTTTAYLAAHRFYEKHGFVQIDAAELPDSFPRMAVDTRFYQMQLEPRL